MQQILGQNHRLKQIMQNCQSQIIELKKIGHEHQQQIDSLLKFNQRLLLIIQNQMPNKVLGRTSSGSNLQPIDQAIEKDQDLIVAHHFSTNPHPIKDKIQHVQNQQIDRLSQQQRNDEQYKKHVNFPLNNHNKNGYKNSNINFPENKSSPSDEFKFRNVQSYQSNLNGRAEVYSQRDSRQQQQQAQRVIIREQKQSMIQIPKLFKLQKGLNDHYHKELFQSLQQSKRPSHLNLKDLRKQSQNSLMNKIAQVVTQRLVLGEQEIVQQFTSIKQLIQEYKQDFNAQQYTHLCLIIKDDLQNDLDQLVNVNQDSLKFCINKQKQLSKLRINIDQFNPLQKLIEIVKNLRVSPQTQQMIVHKIIVGNKKSKIAVKGRK